MLRNDGRFLNEWIEFHRLVGVQKFVLFDNNSTDDSRSVLEPYIAEGVVTLYALPRFKNERETVIEMKTRAYSACVDLYRDRARWIAFLDLDEFLYPKHSDSLPEFLREFEAHPALAVHWVMFSTSGWILRPDDLVTASYTAAGVEGSKHVKLIVNPSRTVRFMNPHWASYEGDALAVDENHQPIAGGYRLPPTVGRIRINHYVTRSVEDFVMGKEVGEGPHDPGHRSMADLFRYERYRSGGDDTCIQRFLPHLREAIAR